MAFMVPVVRSNYDLYRPRTPGSSVSSSRTTSRTVSESECPTNNHLSSSVGSRNSGASPVHRSSSATGCRPVKPAIRTAYGRHYSHPVFTRSLSVDSTGTTLSSSSSETEGCPQTVIESKVGKKSSSTGNLRRLHSRLLEKLRRKLSIGDAARNAQSDENGTTSRSTS